MPLSTNCSYIITANADNVLSFFVCNEPDLELEIVRYTHA